VPYLWGMEETNELTPAAAMLDFETKYFKGLFKHKAGKKAPHGYHVCYQAIQSAKTGEITFERAARILKRYAPPGAYSITEKIETNATSEH